MTTTGVEYEKLTAQVFRLLHQQQAVPNVRVEHDVEVVDVSGSRHQVDVYWEFEVGGVVYRTIVSCKDWSTPVKLDQVRSLHAILGVVPGQPRGLIVARSGFQKGAREFAAAHNILLYELREADERFWEGAIQQIAITANIYSPRADTLELILDRDWLGLQKERLGVPLLQFEIAMQAADAHLRSPEDRPLGTLQDVARAELLPKVQAVVAPEARTHMFDAPTFLLTPGCPVDRVKLLGMSAVVSQSHHAINILVDGTKLVKYVLENLLNGAVYTINDAVTAIRRSE